MAQKYLIETFGCQMNVHDSERMAGLLDQAGYEPTGDARDADVIVINTCAFIDAAKEESVDTILEMAQHKGKAGKLVVTGCLAQRYADDLAKDIPEIDHILGSADFQSLAKAIAPAGTITLPSGRAKRTPLPVIQVSETP